MSNRLLIPRKKHPWTPSRRSFLRGLGASIAAPYVAKAQFGQGQAIGGAGGFGNSVSSGGGGYVAKAVNFDGSSYLNIDALSVPGSPNGYSSFVVWLLFQSPLATGSIFTADPNNSFNSSYFVSDHSGSDWEIIADSGHSSDGSLELDPGVISVFDTWICVIAAMFTNADFDSGNRLGEMYYGDTLVGTPPPPGNSGNVGPAFIATVDGLQFVVGSDTFGDNVTCSMADFRYMPNVNLFTGSSIAEATRRLFIGADGKPVDPAVATAALGAPAVLFSGDASTFGTNQGTGGAFTLTGMLTNASTSPSD